MEHVSVLKSSVQKYLQVEPGGVFVDATLGLGGHSLEIAEKLGKEGKLIAFDLDGKNIGEARKRLKKYETQTILIQDNFRHLKTRITGEGITEVDGILFDLGLSSPHLDEAERGFSFMREGPLDMRLNVDQALTAHEVVNRYKQESLAEIFKEYGEERYANMVARKICDRRAEERFETTFHLAEFIKDIYPGRKDRKPHKTHPATQVFQAIRIEVNDELNALSEALEQSMEILKPGGRLVVISFHSLEDRIVKQFFKGLERPPATPEQAIYQNFGDPLVEILTKKPVIPEEQEVSDNPRARSSKLRACKKI